MAFPQTILERVVQAFIGGAWTDVTQWVYQRDPIVIARGAGAERSQTQFSRMQLTLDNRDLRWSPRVQSGAWFGQLPRRNLLLACSVRLGECFLPLSNVAAWYVSAPDSAGTSVTGDLDVRVDVDLLTWRENVGLAGKWSGLPGQQSWALNLDSAGTVSLSWTADGSTLKIATSAIKMPWPQTQRATVRATLDVNNGAGGYTVTFYYSTTPGTSGPWAQLGDPVVTSAGATSIFDSTTVTTFGNFSTASGSYVEGRFHAGEIRNGIGGSVVASPDCRPRARGTSSWADAQGNTWTVGGVGVGTLTNFRTEFVGELADAPLGRDRSGKDVYVPATATGILRRLGQGQRPLQSTLRRAIPSSASLVAYWPLEDQAASGFAASAMPGATPMRWGAPGPQLAAFEGFPGSAPIPTLNGAVLRGSVPRYSSTGVVQVRCLLAVPAGGAANGAVVLRIVTGGTAPVWDLVYNTGGSFTLNFYDSAGASLGSSGAFGLDQPNGNPLQMSVQLTQSGADVSWLFATVGVGKATGLFASGTLAGRTVTACQTVTVNPGGLLTDTALGHVSVESATSSVFAFGYPIAGWAGETAGRRIQRLCTEQGVVFVPRGDLDDTARMGPQPRDTFLNVLRECETADGGILAEPRDRLGITYTPADTLYSPGVRVTLDAGGGLGGDLSDFASTDDDQLTRNDVTVSRPAGSSYRVTDEAGPLGALEVGSYPDSVTVNVELDEDLADQAGWRLNLGTIDETRLPMIEVHLSRVPLVADTALTTAVVDADLGDGVDVVSPPRGLPATTLRQVIAGRTVRLMSHEYVVQWVGQPAAGYDVAVFDLEHPDEPSRYDSEGSTVNGAHLVGAGTLSVATPVGSLWGHGDGDFTIAIRETGEHMLVTNVAGSSSPQTFTVTRGVDGTTAKALTGGETVELARPVLWGLS